MIKVTGLDKALQIVAPAIGGKVMPILQCAKIDADGDFIKITGNNTEVQISTKIQADIKGDYSFCIDHSKFFLFAKNSGGSEIQITEKDAKATLKAKSRSTLNTLNSEDFPAISVILDDSATVSLSANELAAAIDSVAFSAAANDVRFYLTGILFSIKDGLLTLSASDGVRLAKTSISVKSTGDIYAIIPRSAALSIAKTFISGDIDIQIGRNTLRIDDGTTEMIVKNIDAKYPDFSKVFVMDRQDMVVDKVDLMSAIDSCMISAGSSGALTMSINNNDASLSARNEIGEESNSSMSCDFSGKFEISFKASYLTDVIKKLNGKINIGLHQSSLLISSINTNAKYVVMPIRI